MKLKLPALVLLIFAQSTFALDISFLGGIAKVTSEKTIEISGVSLLGQNKKAKVQLTWNSVSNTFDLSDLATFDASNLLGKWKAQLQNSCTGAFYDYSNIEFKADGTCPYSNGIKCTYTATGGSVVMNWTDYRDYEVVADVINGELIGTITQAKTTRWCIKATFIGP